MKKKKYMSGEDFAKLQLSLEQAIQHARGERHDLRTTVLPAPPKPMKKQEIVKLRQRLNLSQAVFASVLNVSVKTVQAWEQGLRQPSDAALKLLTIAKKHPEVLLA
ncbi:MAG: type II toxin-antitoxin system MqsA family antitoxin [Acidobacteria bacterium]|nr:type II toxin-antitoxin system MqsA family antitoxin [Acidobacteriota bacterium]